MPLLQLHTHKSQNNRLNTLSGGKQNLFYEKIVKVFRREYYITRISGLSFEGRKAYLEIREKWSEEEPLTVELHMSMSMKKITEAIGPDGSQFKTSIKKEEK